MADEGNRWLRRRGERGSKMQNLKVVNIGCGMDTRPWRLHFPPGVFWTDVDTPEIIDLKRKLLVEQVRLSRFT
eukprot:1141594-Pelagomonas_calceolata.AAC.5